MIKQSTVVINKDTPVNILLMVLQEILIKAQVIDGELYLTVAKEVQND